MEPTVANISYSQAPVNSYTPDFTRMRFSLRRGPIVINEKRWYTLLVSSKIGHRARALMDDFPLNNLFRHLIVCYTPDRLPNSSEPLRTKDGKPVHLFAYFDSYIEFFEY